MKKVNIESLLGGGALHGSGKFSVGHFFMRNVKNNSRTLYELSKYGTIQENCQNLIGTLSTITGKSVASHTKKIHEKYYPWN